MGFQWLMGKVTQFIWGKDNNSYPVFQALCKLLHIHQFIISSQPSRYGSVGPQLLMQNPWARCDSEFWILEIDTVIISYTV